MKTGGRHAAALVFALVPAGCLQTVVLEHLAGTGGGSSSLGGAGGGVGAGGVDASPGMGGNLGNDGSVVGGDASGDRIRCLGGGSTSSISVDREIPTIIVALDRSSSMSMRFGTNGGTRFSVTQNAIKDVITLYGPAVVTYGYVEFPGVPLDGSCSNGFGCCASPVLPPVPGASVQQIRNQLDACWNQVQQVGCINTDSTPTTQALSRISKTITGLPGPRYVLLITDGEPSPACPSSSSPDQACMEAANEITNLAFLRPGVSTFVVGVGEINGPPNTDSSGNFCLDYMARAGGIDRGSASPFYYPAKTDDLVRSYLTGIVRGTACHLDITEARSLDIDRVEVVINNNNNNNDVPIARDPNNQNGWNFHEKGPGQPDYTKIDFFGPACDRFISSATSSRQTVVVRGCLEAR